MGGGNQLTTGHKAPTAPPDWLGCAVLMAAASFSPQGLYHQAMSSLEEMLQSLLLENPHPRELQNMLEVCRRIVGLGSEGWEGGGALCMQEPGRVSPWPVWQQREVLGSQSQETGLS